ncbi:MAG: cellulose binding domain-containing protein [Eubacterium sp.]|nr:cellulose binding domain-containing protein [Eubacterium sp.]
MTKKLKKNLCIILVFSILLSGCGEASISAADAGKAIELFSTDPDGDKKTGSSAYSGSGYKVVFSLSDTWDSGFTANITITNTSPVTLKNWALKFNYRGDLSNVWNAEIKGDKNSGYTAENVGWNKDIEPGKSVEFGMSEQTAFSGFPTEYQLIVDQVSEDIIAATAAPGATDAAGSGETVSGTVKKHGRLKVKGRYIVDKHGKKFLIRGPSTHGIAWFPQYVNKACFKSFKKMGSKYDQACVLFIFR